MGMLDSLNILRKAAMGDYTDGTTLNLPFDGSVCRPGDSGNMLPDVFPPALENFSAISLGDLQNNTKSINHGDMSTYAQMWTNASQQLAQNNQQFNDAIGKIVGNQWRGSAADQAKSGIDSYTNETGNLVDALNVVGGKMGQAASGFAQTVAQMPTEVHHNIADKIGESIAGQFLGSMGSNGFSKLVGADHRTHDQAVQVMNNVYAPTGTASDSRTPSLPDALNIINGGPNVPSGPTGPSGPNSPFDFGGPHDQGGPSGPVGPSTPVQPSSVGPSQTQPSSVDPSSVDPSSTQTSPAAASTGSDPLSQLGKTAQQGLGGVGDGSGSPSSTTPAAAALGTTGAGGTRAGGAGAGLGGGSLGSSGGAGSKSPLGSPSLGGAMAGGPSSGAAGGMAAGAPGRAGASGAGMMPHGAKGKGDDDKEHKSADYLINLDNGNELIGKMPKVAPPVLGG